ncbi:MAG: DUF952 domain-containing protein [Pseudomonadota bacterium]|nr:DUF952 domain-containing protein [Pseudomonadota bacterium]
MTGQVFKILPQEIWHTAIAEGAVPLLGVDANDGFVHLSAAEQLQETLRVHFYGQNNLMVLAFDADDLGVGLRWEAARGGQKFPHYYGVLDTGQVRAKFDVSADGDAFALPQELTKRIA